MTAIDFEERYFTAIIQRFDRIEDSINNFHNHACPTCKTGINNELKALQKRVWTTGGVFMGAWTIINLVSVLIIDFLIRGIR